MKSAIIWIQEIAMQQAQIEKTAKVKFATQADPAVLQTLKSIAASEGRQIQAWWMKPCATTLSAKPAILPAGM